MKGNGWHIPPGAIQLDSTGLSRVLDLYLKWSGPSQQKEPWPTIWQESNLKLRAIRIRRLSLSAHTNSVNPESCYYNRQRRSRSADEHQAELSVSPDWLIRYNCHKRGAGSKKELALLKYCGLADFPPEPVKTSWISQQSDPSHLDRPYVTTDYLPFPDDNTIFILLVRTYQDAQASTLSKRLFSPISLVVDTAESKIFNRESSGSKMKTIYWLSNFISLS